MNYLICRNGLFSTHILYMDVINKQENKLYLADILETENVKVRKVKGVFEHNDSCYSAVYCIVSNKYKDKFLKCLHLLTNKMLLLGYNDYIETTTNMLQKIENDYWKEVQNKSERKRRK